MSLELTEVAKDWDWLADLKEFNLLAISPFGDLLLQDASGSICLLDINLGSLEAATEAGVNPSILFPMAFDDAIAAGYRKDGLHLSSGTCYGYKRQLVTGATMESANVYIATLSEYLSFMGSFHDQIKDVADGETVVLEVVNRKVVQ
ncbi:hypothetical protein HDF16_002310 [Granulicella aggregans]|uniref:Uncharacterized protein n=1 Tax=Granulicella aggregans TaxID=474949 RepID=A0A7W8E3U7_9BACT|nr:hypothetical protein [Granulicella aggregans]MBB5057604.1 hypothetical protein [Granulicella aggregans]